MYNVCKRIRQKNILKKADPQNVQTKTRNKNHNLSLKITFRI